MMKFSSKVANAGHYLMGVVITNLSW